MQSSKEKLKNNRKLPKGLIVQFICLIILIVLVVWALFNRAVLPYADLVAAITFFVMAFNKKETKGTMIALIVFGILFILMAVGGIING